MADTKTSALASLGTPIGADYVFGVLASGPTDKKLLVSDLRDYTNMVQATGTDANTTMAVNTMYVVDMSAWATADRTYTNRLLFHLFSIIIPPQKASGSP